MEKTFSGQILCSCAFGANIRSYTKQRARHGTPFLQPPPPPSAGVHVPPPPPPQSNFQVAQSQYYCGPSWILFHTTPPPPPPHLTSPFPSLMPRPSTLTLRQIQNIHDLVCRDHRCFPYLTADCERGTRIESAHVVDRGAGLWERYRRWPAACTSPSCTPASKRVQALAQASNQTETAGTIMPLPQVVYATDITS